jgi:DNA-binding transcriptional MocR family regulator
MKAGSRPQYYRIRRMVQMVREGSETGYLPNSRDFMGEFGVSRRTVARDLDLLREEERTPLEYDEARHGFRLTDRPSACLRCGSARREAFSCVRTKQAGRTRRSTRTASKLAVGEPYGECKIPAC